MRDLVRLLRLLDAIGVIAGLGWNMALSVIAVLGGTGGSRQGRRQRRPGRCNGWECRFVFWSFSDLDLKIARSWRRRWGIHATASSPPFLDTKISNN